MTEDELDRALFALPLEEPPADLHGRIMAATALRPAPTFTALEICVLVLSVALVGSLTFWMFASTPHAGSRLADTIVAGARAMGLFSRSTYVWLAVGISSVWWISSLPFMATPRSTVYNR
jgi:hypothetical protein